MFLIIIEPDLSVKAVLKRNKEMSDLDPDQDLVWVNTKPDVMPLN